MRPGGNGSAGNPGAAAIPLEVAIFGAGRLATVAAALLVHRAKMVRVFGRRTETLEVLRGRFPTIETSTDILAVAAPADLVLFAVPAAAILEVAEAFGKVARGDQIVIHGTRGAGSGFLLPHQMIRAKTCVRKIGALGGPLHSRDFESGRALPLVLASRFSEPIEMLRALTDRTPLRVHGSQDIVGVETAGAISNVSAIAAGIALGLGLGETAKGLLLAHGLSEAQQLALRLGAEASTFVGLAGVGDLIPRSVSSTDRHLELGRRLAQNEPLEAALAALLAGGGNIEGIVTAKEARALARTMGLELPLIEAVSAILEGSEPDIRPKIEAVLAKDLRELLSSAKPVRDQG